MNTDRVAELAVAEWEKNHSAQVASERLRKAANELAIVAAINPVEIDRTELAKLSARILALAWQVELGERINPSRTRGRIDQLCTPPNRIAGTDKLS